MLRRLEAGMQRELRECFTMVVRARCIGVVGCDRRYQTRGPCRAASLWLRPSVRLAFFPFKSHVGEAAADGHGVFDTLAGVRHGDGRPPSLPPRTVRVSCCAVLRARTRSRPASRRRAPSGGRGTRGARSGEVPHTHTVAALFRASSKRAATFCSSRRRASRWCHPDH